MRYDAEHKSRTRARVLEEAARAIRAEGPHKVAVAEVMARAGLTHGGFYAHFKSKDEMVAAAVGEMFAQTSARLGEMCAGCDGRAALTAYLRYYLSRRHVDSRDAGCPLPALANDLPRLDADTRARFGEGVARLTARLHRLLEAASIADPEVLAPSILNEVVGAVSLARATPDATQSDAILSASRASLAARLALPELSA